MSTSPVPFTRVGWLALVLIGATAWPALADVTGKWATNGPFPSPFVFDVVQSGSSLTMNLGVPFTGTINPGGSFAVSYSEPGLFFGMGGRFLVGETYFAANTVALTFGTPTFDAASGIRCECADGNSTAGDGCDPRCQIEPCFTCTGMPSVCTPSPDGTACNDRNACTSGETCTAGACGGSSPIVPCVNLTGSWFVRETSVNGPQQESSRTSIRQVGSALEFGGSPTSLPGTIGAIDPATGVFDTWQPIVSFNCGLETRHGTAAPDGNTYTASGNDLIPISDYCAFDPVVVTAWRCGSGTVDPGEQCDDGNTADGDGCSATCRSEFCATQPNGTPCDDGDPCTNGDACQSGTCVGTLAPGAPCDDGVACTSGDVCDFAGGCQGVPDCAPCHTCSALSGCVPAVNGTPCYDGAACTNGDACVGTVCQGTSTCGPCLACSGASGCIAAPSQACVAPDASGASLAVTDGGDPMRASVAFRWQQAAGGSIDFGAPDTTDDYDLCVFDTSAPTPSLLFRARAPAGEGCPVQACWTPKPNGGFKYKDPARTPDGLVAFALQRNATGAVTVSARAKGALLTGRPYGLPVTPVPVPFTVQVVGEGGTCLEAQFAAGAVQKNQAGKLKARLP